MVTCEPLSQRVRQGVVLMIRTGGLPGGQSEYVRVPFGEVNCLKVPKGVPGKLTVGHRMSFSADMSQMSKLCVCVPSGYGPLDCD